MERRVFVFFCLLGILTSEVASNMPKITVDTQNKVLKCEKGTFKGKDPELKRYEDSDVYQCSSENCDENTCPKALVKILDSENLIELNLKDVVSVLISDILVTVLIGWALYSVCSQPVTRASYQGSKASDRQALINNHAPSGGDTYQRLNTRQDEYSALHAPRKHKNKQSV